MIAVGEGRLSDIERSQMERRSLAVGSWAQGDIENASTILNSVLGEPMTPRVAVQCFVSQAAFRVDVGDYSGSLDSLENAARFLEAADIRFQGAFHNQRARVHKELGHIDAALTDYAGASACFELAGDRDYQGAALLNTAGLYLLIGDLAAARASVGQSFAILSQINSVYLCQAYDTLANIELADGRLEHAVTAIGKAFELVGENGIWRQTFIETRDKIDEKLREVSSSLHQVNVDLVRWGLIKTGGNLTQTGNLAGLTHKGVSYIVDRYPDLESLRARRRKRTRLTSKFK